MARRTQVGAESAKGRRLRMPQEVLLRPNVVEALGEWRWDVALHAFTQATGATQTELSEVTGLSQATVSRLISGRIKTLSLQNARALCDGLGIPRDLAGLAPKSGATGASVEEDTTDRREFITGVGAAGAVAFLPTTDLPEQISPGEAENEVQRLHDAIPRLLALNDQHGGTSGLQSLAAGLVQRGDALLQYGLPSAQLTRGTQSVVGYLAMVAGWLYYDGGDQPRARGYWQHALYQSQLAEDAVTEVYALGSLAVQATFLLDRPREAVWLAQRAQGIAKGWASPAMESLVHMREACAWAVQGNEYEFNRALRRAHNLYAEPQEDDPAWLGFYGFGEVTGLEALAYVELDRFARAEALLRRAMGQIGPRLHRNQVYYTAMLGRCIADAGDVTRAAETLEPHVEEIATSGSWRAHRHVRRVARAAYDSKSPTALAFADTTRDVGIMA